MFENLSADTMEQQHWQNMPEFNQADKTATRQIIVSFDNEDSVRLFAERLGITVTAKTKSIWYPAREKNSVKELFWITEQERE